MYVLQFPNRSINIFALSKKLNISLMFAPNQPRIRYFLQKRFSAVGMEHFVMFKVQPTSVEFK